MVPSVLHAANDYNIDQVRNLMQNLTTVEYLEKKDAAFAHGIFFRRDPYDLGLINNISAVLGRNPLLWLFPQPMEGNGHDFERLGEDAEIMMDNYTRPWD